MSKNKEYTKMILHRLNKKIEDNHMLKDPFSNQKTQATPNQLSSSKNHSPRTFFDYFQSNIVTIHEPVLIKTNKSHKRPLFFELCEIEYRRYKEKDSLPQQRLNTVPAFVSQFREEDRKLSKGGPKENRSSIYVKKTEDKNTNCKSIQNNATLMRYKSLKTIPSPTNYPRRLLVYQNSQFKSNELKDNYCANYYNRDNYLTTKQLASGGSSKQVKAEKKKSSPRKYMKKCESYEKYMMQKIL